MESGGQEREVSPTAGLLERARGGDANAFDQLFARALPRLDWFVRIRLGKSLGKQLDPEDVVQETYAAALPLLKNFEARGRGTFVPWLFAIAENQVRRLAKHHGAQRRRGPMHRGPADAALALAADPASGPCTRAARIENRMRIASALEALVPEQREALVLRVMQGLELKDIAQRLGRSESSVRRLVAAATEALGRELSTGQHNG